MVWFERNSPRSRYGQVHLELLTTANMLSASGLGAMRALGADWNFGIRSRASPHEAHWDHVPVRDLDRLAKAAYRAATGSGCCQPNRPKLIRIKAGGTAKVVRLEDRELPYLLA